MMSFGDVAAEDDAVLDYFVATNAVDRIKKGETFLVLGRKGTGKTAIVRYFTERDRAGDAKSLSLKGYPWNIHAARIDRGASDVEAYVSSWKYLIAVELASLALLQRGAYLTGAAQQINNFLMDNYGGPSPSLADILTPPRLRLSKLSFMPALFGNQLGGIELDRSPGDMNFGRELDALSDSIIAAVHECLRECRAAPLSLHFDELDQGVTTLNDQRKTMLIGLILAARSLRHQSNLAGVAVNPVVYLRTDIWDDLQFSDKNKISQTLTLKLEWTPQTLQEMVRTRVKAKLGDHADWDTITEPELMRGTQSKWSHLVARTFLRPRDVISFLNTVLNSAKKRDPDVAMINNRDIVNSRSAYSNYLKDELDDEIVPHWQYWPEALQACSAIGNLTFGKDDFEREYMMRRSSKNTISTDEALALLYRFSIVGYRGGIGYGGSSWVFQYAEPASGWDSVARNFKVHLGLKEYAKLREERRT